MKKKNFFNCICIHKSPNVKYLDYSGRYLRQVPQDIFNHERTLESLNLDNNNISELTKELFCCRSLRMLILRDNELCNLPDAVENLNLLINLDISKNNLQCLPDKLGLCGQLETLDASGNAFEGLPDGLCRLTMLQELMVNTAFLTTLPQNIGRLVNLRHLEARENEIKSLPVNIGALVNLQHLDVGNNDLTELPDSLCRLSNLTVLCADKNSITYLPANLGQCRGLQSLELQNNCLTNLPDSLCSCGSLTELLLSGNELRCLPVGLGQLTALTNLRLDNNHISRLPDSLGHLESLTQLYVSFNELTQLPQSIGLLRRLRDLHADSNTIAELPQEIGSCSSLTVLSLRGNRIQYLPDEIGRIPRLRMINLSNNRVKFLPFSFLKLRELQAVWLNDNQIQPLVQLQSERDVDTGRKCLVCYLLPQMSNTDNPDAVDNDPSAWQAAHESRPRVVQWNDEAASNGATDSAAANLRTKPLPKDAPAKQVNAKHILSKPHNKPQQQQQPQKQNQPVQNGVSFQQSPAQTWNHEVYLQQQQQQLLMGQYLQQQQQQQIQHQRMFMQPGLGSHQHGHHNWGPVMGMGVMSGYDSDSAAVHMSRQSRAHVMHPLDLIREAGGGDLGGFNGGTNMGLGSGGGSLHPHHGLHGRLVGGARQSGYSTDTGLASSRRPLGPPGSSRATSSLAGGTGTNKTVVPVTAPHYKNPYDQLRIMRSLPPLRRAQYQQQILQQQQLLQQQQQHPLINSSNGSASNLAGGAGSSLPPPPSRPPPPPSRPLPAPPFRPSLLQQQQVPDPTSVMVPPPPSRTPPHMQHPGLTSISPSLIDDPSGGLQLHQLLVAVIRQSSGLGFSITGGLSSNPNPFRPADKGIFIAKVNPCGPADGRLRVGDKILSVNSCSFLAAEHATAVGVLKSCGDTVQMLVERLSSSTEDGHLHALSDI